MDALRRSIVVGERGPEVFIPDEEGTVVPGDILQFTGRPGNFTPDVGPVRPGEEWLAYAQRQPMVEPRAEAWGRWLADLPESENVEDRRDDMARDMDDLRWRKAHGPKKPLVQFPAVTETPLWLRANEEQWLRTK
jgi:hypothetical protein